MQDHSPPPNQIVAPINPLPPIVWLLVLPMIGIEIAVSLAANGLIGGAGGIGWRAEAQQMLGFAPDYLRQMIERQDYPLTGLRRMVTYPFVHLDATHTLFVAAIFLALGKFVGEVFAWWAVALVFFAAAIVGACAYTAVPLAHSGLIGGYPALYGLIGAYSFLLWVQLAGDGVGRVRAFRLIGVLLAYQVVFGLFTLLYYGAAVTNWDFVADLAGFATGFILSFVVSPGGWARVLAKIRAAR